jgi:endoglucanase
MRSLFLAALLALLPLSAYAAGQPLPAGYLSVSGNQIISGNGQNVRLACVGYNEPSGNYAADMSAIANAGFNCVRYPYYDASLNLSTMDAIVSAAQASNIRVIFDHHGNEADNNCLSQQANGLWYDLNDSTGSNSNNTDGCGEPGTITYATFRQNWINIATHYAGNTTVIGFDLDNEPLVGGTGTNANLTWGANTSPSADLQAMYNDVGSAIHAVDPGALIICEGPINYTYVYLNGATMPVEGLADLTQAKTYPINVAGKILYSIHEYPQAISGINPDSGATHIQGMNQGWGYLESTNTAPVFIGEMGADLDNSNGDLSDEQAWANMMVAYLNGLSGGTGQSPDGILNADGTLRTGQQAVWSQLLYSPSGIPTTTWNPNDDSGMTLSNNNETATSSVATGSGVRSTSGKSAGLYCAQITLTTTSNHAGVGIGSSADNLTGYIGGTGSSSVGLYVDYGGQQIQLNGNVAAENAAVADGASGDVVTVVLDATHDLVYFSTPEMVTAGTPWNDSASANPSTGTGGINIAAISPPYFLEANTHETGAAFTLNPSPSGCPVNSVAWDTAVAGGSPITVILGMNLVDGAVVPSGPN